MTEISVRCSECRKPAVEMTKYQQWLKLYSGLEFLYTEGSITAQTYENLLGALMTMKSLVDE